MGRVQAEGSWGVGPHGTEDRVAPGPCACRRAGSDGMQGGEKKQTVTLQGIYLFMQRR